MKKLIILCVMLFGSNLMAEEFRIPEWRGYPPNNPRVCKTYLIRNDVYRVYSHYDGWGNFLYREEIYWYSYYTRETRCTTPRRIHEICPTCE